jgi:hypothetical protein
MSPRARILLALTFALVAASLLVTLAAALGAVLWQEDGVALCTAVDDQKNHQIVSDGSRGAIVTWEDYRFSSASSAIYAQRVGPGGDALWPIDGVVLCTFTHNSTQPQLASDGSGGAVVTWLDHRAGGGAADIRAQRVGADGSALWVADGEKICPDINSPGAPQITSHGSGGAIIAWGDFRSGVDTDLYAQRVDSGGNVLWDTGGLTVCAAADTQAEPQLAPDGSGGAIIVWEDKRSSFYDIYAQRVDANGNTLWYADGVSICTSIGHEGEPQLAPDGSGGAFITWGDERGPGDYIYAQWVDADGNIMWQDDGIRLCGGGTNTPDQPQIVADGAGGAIVAWRDARDSELDIYAQRVGNVDGVYLPLAVKQY